MGCQVSEESDLKKRFVIAKIAVESSFSLVKALNVQLEITKLVIAFKALWLWTLVFIPQWSL